MLEAFLIGGSSVLQSLTDRLNEIVSTGNIPESWCNTVFNLLHKGGGTEDPNNWHPIAILSIAYKILARLVYDRIRYTFDGSQSDNQYGFREGRSTIQALLLMGSMISSYYEVVV